MGPVDTLNSDSKNGCRSVVVKKPDFSGIQEADMKPPCGFSSRFPSVARPSQGSDLGSASFKLRAVDASNSVVRRELRIARFDG